MLKHVIVLSMLVALVVIGCQQEQPPSTERVLDEDAINQLLDKYVTAVETGDTTLYFSLVAHDTDMVNFGAFGGPIYGWQGLKDAITNQFASLSNVKINVTNVDVHDSGCIDWARATSLWQFQATMGDRSFNLPIRCTWILRNRDGKWLIVHFHKSVSQG